MKQHKKIEQRTFLQDRFDILIKKQKTGQATFSELTELDEIVNRYATIREKILEEMHELAGPPDGPADDGRQVYISKKQAVSLLEKIISFFGRMFILKLPVSATLPFITMDLARLI